MKTNHRETLADMLADAIDEARAQKRRVRRHLVGLRGDEYGSTPIRGPWLPGRPGVKWHLYQAAIRKHQRLTNAATALAWVMGNFAKQTSS
jgi:hypothetical protein